MIELIVKILNIDNAYKQSRLIDFAKGSDKLPESFKEAWKQFKRERSWQ